MTINYNPNLLRNDSLDPDEIYNRAIKCDPDTVKELTQKAYETAGVPKSLAKAAAWHLENTPATDYCEDINEIAGAWARKYQRGND